MFIQDFFQEGMFAEGFFVIHKQLTITGNPEEGSTLSSVLIDSDGISGVVVYQWQRSADGVVGWESISGATSSSYTLTEDDAEVYIRLRVTYTDDEGNNEDLFSEVTSQIQGFPINLSRLGNPYITILN